MPDLPLRDAVLLIGEDAVKTLIRERAGFRFNIPKKVSTLEFSNMDEQRRKFRDMVYHEGMTPAEIADEYELTPKRVRDIINGK